MKLTKLAIITALGALLGLSLNAKTEVYDIDTVHSGVTFKVRYLLNQVPGNFADFNGVITLDRENLTNSSVEAQIQTASIQTNNEDRDAHLRSDDFFSAAAHPTITFTSTKWEEAEGDNRYSITGNLTMNGVTREVVLDAHLDGFTEHPMTNRQVTGWTATTSIDRRHWNVDYGQGVIGNEVQIELGILGILRDDS